MSNFDASSILEKWEKVGLLSDYGRRMVSIPVSEHSMLSDFIVRGREKLSKLERIMMPEKLTEYELDVIKSELTGDKIEVFNNIYKTDRYITARPMGLTTKI